MLLKRPGLASVLVSFYKKEPMLLLLPLVFLFGLGLWLRLNGTDFALPTISYDESYILDRVWLMSNTGDLNPHTFNWSSLHFYVDLSILKLLQIGGPVEWSTFALACRIFEAVIGAASILVIYLIARQVYNRIAGLIAAGFMAIFPGHIFYSHVAKVDVFLAFWVLMAFLFSIYIARTGKWRYYLLAAVCAGLATGTKYNGIFAGLFPVIAHFIAVKEGKTRLLEYKNLATIAGAAAIAFFLTTPYSLLDFRTFFSDLLWQGGRTSFDLGSNISGYREKLSQDMGWVTVILSLAGLVYALVRRTPYTLLLVGSTIIYSLSLFFIWNDELRFFLPVGGLAFVLIAGMFIQIPRHISTRFARNKYSPVILGLILGLFIVYPVVEMGLNINADSSKLGKTSISTLAVNWFTKNVPPGSTVYRGNNTPYVQMLLDKKGAYIYESPREPQSGREPTWDYDSYAVFNTEDYKYVILDNSHRNYLDNPDTYPSQYNFYAQFYQSYSLATEIKMEGKYSASTIEATQWGNSLYIFKKKTSTSWFK
jgi:4-amino-4-deoxy-L-arabinose transferase-like glycosyltransferase